jgi:hypothetical protein
MNKIIFLSFILTGLGFVDCVTDTAVKLGCSVKTGHFQFALTSGEQI